MPARAAPDQASGLRRLLRREHAPALIVLNPADETTDWLAQALRRRAGGRRVALLDADGRAGGLADLLGVEPRFDLLFAAQGEMRADACLQRVGLSELGVVAGLLRRARENRLAQARAVDLLQALGHERDESILVVRKVGALSGAGLDAWADGLLLVLPAGDGLLSELCHALDALAWRGAHPRIYLSCAGACLAPEAHGLLLRLARDIYGLELHWAPDLPTVLDDLHARLPAALEGARMQAA